ncbi:hypothetical protein [Shinella sedimenti]|uniref:Uncharacterized protein n=1 Tax=Shinella sedimenti TaxID=2919913 RepID=A0ABT0CLJ4_9HYPH|nr:hypothetical protein [Shinella sedimenti]MCJ8149482.1 hypothetical protein [Shinella sedimenti]
MGFSARMASRWFAERRIVVHVIRCFAPGTSPNMAEAADSRRISETVLPVLLEKASIFALSPSAILILIDDVFILAPFRGSTGGGRPLGLLRVATRAWLATTHWKQSVSTKMVRQFLIGQKLCSSYLEFQPASLEVKAALRYQAFEAMYARTRFFWGTWCKVEAV